MSYNIIATPKFKKDLKKLAKKQPSIKNDFGNLLDSLEHNPEQGTYLGNNCYKIRLAISSKGKGKSAGSRIITHIVIEKDSVYLLAIYDKGDQESLLKKEIEQLIKLISK